MSGKNSPQHQAATGDTEPGSAPDTSADGAGKTQDPAGAAPW
mgnify:FL=1